MKKILNLIHTFRTSKCFLLPSEVKAALTAQEYSLTAPALEMRKAAEKIVTEMTQQRERFRSGIIGLTAAKIETRKPYIQLTLQVNINSLETAAGPEAAAAMIATEVAQQIVGRHQKTCLKK